MRKVFVISVIFFAFLFFVQSNGYAQAKSPSKNVAVKAQKGSGQNVMQPSDDKPREKTKKRGYCYVWFDNPTGYYVDVWVEDIYQGRLSPYSTSVRINVWTPGVGQNGMRKLREVLIPGVTIAIVMIPGDSQLHYSIF